jgi:hypothetical protein
MPCIKFIKSLTSLLIFSILDNNGVQSGEARFPDESSLPGNYEGRKLLFAGGVITYSDAKSSCGCKQYRGVTHPYRQYHKIF